MKARMIGVNGLWLDGDFQPPSPSFKAPHLRVRKVNTDPHSGSRALKLLGDGVGIWDASGSLVRYERTWSDAVWTGTRGLLVADNRFQSPRRGQGVEHALLKLSADAGIEISEVSIVVPTGGCEYLIPNESTGVCLVTWLDQSDWGYVGFHLDSLARLQNLTFRWPSPTITRPQFSPSGEVIVSCNLVHRGWWVPPAEDFYSTPSPGGSFDVGVIAVQRTADGTTTTHPVTVDLPAGWQPADVRDATYSFLDTPRFVSDNTLTTRLPDGSTLTVKLPFPSRIHLDRPLKTTRTD